MNNHPHLYVALLAALLLATASHAQTITWTLSNEYPASTLPAEADQHFARRAAEVSQGRLSITPHFDAKLGLKTAQHLQAVANNKVQMASSFTSAFSEAEPMLALSNLPFLTATVDDSRRLLDIARPHYERVLARHGQKLLYASPWPPSGLWAKEPVTTLEALRRQRVRTFDDTSAAILKQLGATAMTISFSDAMARIQAGDVNAVLSSGDGGAGRRLWEHLPHFTEWNYALPLSIATVNLEAWNALDASLREALDKLAEETTALQWQRMSGRVAANYALMRNNQVAIAQLPPSGLATDLRVAAKGIVDAWAAKVAPDGARILEVYARR
jgi:TRAP-type C4-dicarboxylate transport system substrate-binding protein